MTAIAFISGAGAVVRRTTIVLRSSVHRPTKLSGIWLVVSEYNHVAVSS